MIEYIWIAGVSRSGKGTLIHRLAHDEAQCSLLEVVTPVSFLLASVAEPPEQFGVDEIVEQSRLQSCASFLIKWQFYNARTGRIRSLISRAPEARHRVLVIERPDEEILAAWRSGGRPYCADHSDEARARFLQSERDELRDHLLHDRLPAGLSLNVVTWTGSEYKIATT